MAGREGEVTPLIVLSAIFAVALTSANFLSAKLFKIDVLGFSLVGPAGVLAYSATFAATDIISEVYGRRHASTVVKAGFLAQLAAVVFTLAALKSPIYEGVSPVGQQEYSMVVFAGYNIIIASLTAYIISQLHDVWAFHYWRKLTGGRWLWLRNNASTIISQLLDTVIFISLAFNILPALLGGEPLPWGIVASIIVSQYIIKVGIALLDTPIVYLGVALTKLYMQEALTIRGIYTLTKTARPSQGA